MGHENHLLGFAGTNSGRLGRRRGHLRGRGPPFPGFTGPSQEAAPTAPPPRRHPLPTSSLRLQAPHCRRSSSPVADAAGQEAQPDPQGTAGRHGPGLNLARLHYVLVRLGLTVPTSSGPGGGGRLALIRRGWSSLTNRARKPACPVVVAVPSGARVHASAPAGRWQTTTMLASIRLDGSTACMTIE